MNHSRHSSLASLISKCFLCLTFHFLLHVYPAASAELQPDTVRAWDRYFTWANDRVEQQLADSDRFLIEDYLPPTQKASVKRRLEGGEIVVQRIEGVVPRDTSFEVPNGEIHHWWGAVLVPHTTLEKLMVFLQDYGNHAGRFADVEKSQLLLRNGDYFKFYFRLRRTKAFVTAYYNTEQECTYRSWSPSRISSHSIATKIAELEGPGTSAEREKPPGNDRGFLWRLVSWWRFEETPRGVIVEVESASLSRDIPMIVKLIPGVSGYIRSTPKESVESVLSSIRDHAPKQ